MAKYDDDLDGSYRPPGDEPRATAPVPGGLTLRRLVLRLAIVAGFGVVAVAALYVWADLFICDLWGPLFRGRLPGAFGRFCR